MNNLATIKRHAERAVPDEAAEILNRGLVAHVGFGTDSHSSFRYPITTMRLRRT